MRPALIAVVLALAGCGSSAPPPPAEPGTSVKADMLDHQFTNTDMGCVRHRLIRRAQESGWTVTRQNAQTLVLDRPTAMTTMGVQGTSVLTERMVLAFVPDKAGTRMHQGAALLTIGANGAETVVAEKAVSEQQVALFQFAIESQGVCQIGVPRA